MSVRPTALGWKAVLFTAALVVAYYSAPYQNLFFLLLVFLAVLGVCGTVWTWRNGRGVSGEVEDVEPSVAGAPVPFAARLTAAKGAHVQFRVVVEVATRDGVAAAAAPVAAVAGETRVAGEFGALPRGIHALRGAWLESTYPLGILRVRRPLAAPAEVVVHPVPSSLHGAPGRGLAALAGAAGGVGADQPSGLRDWRDGDEVRTIHWRATARRGRPVVTERDALAGDGLEIVLDRRCGAEALESALSTVAALVLAARDMKERLTIHTQGTSRTFGPGHGGFDEALRLLAGADVLPPGGPPPPPAATTVLRLPRRTEAVPA